MFGTLPMLSPPRIRVKPKAISGFKRTLSQSRTQPFTRHTPAFEVKPGSHLYSCFDYFWGGLSFTATRRLREDSQRSRGLNAAALLEFVDPVGHGFHHIARSFTRRVGLSLGYRRANLLFTLFNYSNCFLLRHCFFLSFPLESIVSNEFLVSQFPN